MAMIFPCYFEYDFLLPLGFLYPFSCNPVAGLASDIL